MIKLTAALARLPSANAFVLVAYREDQPIKMMQNAT
jgi:hypothetical protein